MISSVVICPSRKSRVAPAAASISGLLTAAVLAAVVAEMPAQRQFAELGQRLPVANGASASVALGDVDGDGDLDLVVGNELEQNRLYRNDGRGVFVDDTLASMPADVDRCRDVVFGDVDGDGDLDLILANGGVGFVENRLYLNDGSGHFADVTASHLPPGGGVDPTLGDVDGDGDLDLVCASFVECSNGVRNRLLLNDGSGVFTDNTATHMPYNGQFTFAVALGDVDGDGDLDVVCANAEFYCSTPGPGLGTGVHSLYLNDGAGVFSDATASRMPFGTNYGRSVELGDLDGDGDLDVVFGDWPQDRIGINDGNGFFVDASASRLPASATASSALAVEDVDGDGDLDLISGNGRYLAEQNRLYLNDGSGTFSEIPGQMPADQDWSRAVASGDLDGDGDPDLVFANLGAQNSLYLNLVRQLDAPIAPQLGQHYQLDLYARYGVPRLFDVVLPYLSLSSASVAVPGLGTIGIDLAQAAPMPPLLIPQPAGVASTSFVIPNNAALVGLELFAQAAHVPFPRPIRLTNATRGVVQ